MKFTIKTLVDITEAEGIKRTDSPSQYRQNQNWMTVLQTASLRVNIYNNEIPTVSKEKVDGVFGLNFKGKQNVWTTTFEVEAENGLSIDMLETDFDLVPIISNLEETIDLESKVFRTRDSKEKNIVFV